LNGYDTKHLEWFRSLIYILIYTEFEFNRHKRNNAVTKLRISKVSNEVDIAMKRLIDALIDPMENFLSNILLISCMGRETDIGHALDQFISTYTKLKVL
jgi:hypothetical protein